MITNLNNLANNCLNCPTKPCISGCPLQNNIPKVISHVKNNDLKFAYNELTHTTLLPYTCGTVCPHTKQCQGSCVKNKINQPVQIGNIEQFIGKTAIEQNFSLPPCAPKRNKRVAVIGGGPCGLTCAGFLCLAGVDVTIFEKHSSLGGIAQYGIPDFRLNKELLQKEINRIINLGVCVKTNMTLGQNLHLSEVLSEFDAVFLSFGANLGKNLKIQGENNAHVLNANEILEYNNFPSLANKRVLIIGGGNVALDCARTTKSLGANVTVVYRRSEKEMPAEANEIAEAKAEGVLFTFLTTPKSILQEGEILSLVCTKNSLDASTPRPTPVEIPNSEHILYADYIFNAVGAVSDSKLIKECGLQTDTNGFLQIKENNQTNNPKIFAGGDLCNCTSTVAWACNSGKASAENILKYLNVK